MPSQRLTMNEFKLQARIEELEEELEAERQARAKVSRMNNTCIFMFGFVTRI